MKHCACRTHLRAARQLALLEYLLTLPGPLVLDGAAYRALSINGHTRTQAEQALNDLVTEGLAEIRTTGGRVEVALLEGRPH